MGAMLLWCLERDRSRLSVVVMAKKGMRFLADTFVGMSFVCEVSCGNVEADSGENGP
jgi:hypothetical protein